MRYDTGVGLAVDCQGSVHGLCLILGVANCVYMGILLKAQPMGKAILLAEEV